MLLILCLVKCAHRAGGEVSIVYPSTEEEDEDEAYDGGERIIGLAEAMPLQGEVSKKQSTKIGGPRS